MGAERYDVFCERNTVVLLSPNQTGAVQIVYMHLMAHGLARSWIRSTSIGIDKRI